MAVNIFIASSDLTEPPMTSHRPRNSFPLNLVTARTRTSLRLATPIKELPIGHYISHEGQKITLTWVANENGFQPKGDHSPTPIPEEIVRVLPTLPKLVENYKSA